MNKSIMDRFNILDLPNEILLTIFNKLNSIDVFYSITNVNRRFYELSFDCSHVRDLQMTLMMNVMIHFTNKSLK